VTVSGLTPTRTRLRDRSIELSYSIPKDDIRRVNRPAIMECKSTQLTDSKSGTAGGGRGKDAVAALSEREADYRDTVVLIDAGGRCSAAELADVGADLYESTRERPLQHS